MADDRKSRKDVGTPPDTAGFGVTPLPARSDLPLRLPVPDRLAAALASAQKRGPVSLLDQLEYLKMAREATDLVRAQALETLRASIANPHAFSHGVVIPERHELVAKPDPQALPEDVAAMVPQARDLTASPAGPVIVRPDEVDRANFGVIGPHVTTAQAKADPAAAIATIAADPTHQRASRLQEIRAYAGELTDRHVHELCAAMTSICDGMAQHVKHDKRIDAEAVRGELLEAVTDAQAQVLELIRILKTQVPPKHWQQENRNIATFVGEELSEILVTASNAAMDKAGLSKEQRELYVDLSQVVLDGMFKKPRFHEPGGGSDQSVSR